jgi:class 3 adenylate cyclase
MRRNIFFSFAIGIVVAVLVGLAHAIGLLGPAELPLQDWMQRAEVPPRVVGNLWQSIFITLVSVAVAWLTLATTRRHRVAWLLLGFAAEMLVLVWVGSLYHLFFQPIPCILVGVFAYIAGIGYLAWQARPPRPKPVPLPEPAVPAVASEIRPVLKLPVRQKLTPKEPAPAPQPVARPQPVAKPQPILTQAAPQPAVTKQPISPLPAPVASMPAVTSTGAPQLFEATVLVCDLAYKYDLVDNSEPATAARSLAKFSQHASELLLEAGAHLHKADGEGVVALFGYPQPIHEHAEKAVCAAIDLIRAFSSEAHGSNGDTASANGAHIGISSGDLIAGRSEGKHELFVLGEAIELARRFCLANRFYGSRILIGPQTFEMASSAVVARPIDFLTGVTAQERHEIYEPMALAADAPAELLARRDSFWNGVVLYREKRWVEALSEFQKARGGGADEDDPPLNLYLRRLEPLALHFLESGRE